MLRFWTHTTRWSTVAFAGFLVLGLLSMGLLGAVLYYPVAPLLRLRFPAQDEWRGDWVWPAVIGVGMAWSLSFLLAGAVNHWLVRRGCPNPARRLAYLGVLWLWALVVWFVCLESSPVRPA